MKTLCAFIMIITASQLLMAKASFGELATDIDMRKAAIKAGIQSAAFDKVIRYYSKYYNQIENKGFLSFIDLSLPSTEERLFVINIETGRISRFLVAHGKNSGDLYAEEFSNSMESKMTSLGLYKVQEQYDGKHGASLAMDGLEKSNSSARERSIVMHKADYVSEEFIKKEGRIGRSWGCPAVSNEDWDILRPRLRGGSLMLIYQ